MVRISRSQRNRRKNNTATRGAFKEIREEITCDFNTHDIINITGILPCDRLFRKWVPLEIFIEDLVDLLVIKELA